MLALLWKCTSSASAYSFRCQSYIHESIVGEKSKHVKPNLHGLVSKPYDMSLHLAYVQIEGTAQMTADSDALLYWATRIGGRYMGEALAEAYGKRNGVAEELLVRVTPTKILFEQNIAS
jgi:hypothetical protein